MSQFKTTVNVLKFPTLFLTKKFDSLNACQNSKQWRTWSYCSFRSSLIWIWTVFFWDHRSILIWFCNLSLKHCSKFQCIYPSLNMFPRLRMPMLITKAQGMLVKLVMADHPYFMLVSRDWQTCCINFIILPINMNVFFHLHECYLTWE